MKSDKRYGFLTFIPLVYHADDVCLLTQSGQTFDDFGGIFSETIIIMPIPMLKTLNISASSTFPIFA